MYTDCVIDCPSHCWHNSRLLNRYTERNALWFLPFDSFDIFNALTTDIYTWFFTIYVTLFHIQHPTLTSTLTLASNFIRSLQRIDYPCTPSSRPLFYIWRLFLFFFCCTTKWLSRVYMTDMSVRLSLFLTLLHCFLIAIGIYCFSWYFSCRRGWGLKTIYFCRRVLLSPFVS